MSVAAMTLDDQRPLNTYDKMSKQYDQNLHGGVGGGSSGPASPTPSGSEESPASQHQPYHHLHHHHHPPHLTSHHHHQHHLPQYHHHRQQHSAMAHQQSPPSPVPSPHLQQPQKQHQHEQHQSLSNANTAAAVAVVEHRQRLLEEEIEGLKLEQTRLSQQCADAQRREKILMRRLANKEQEFQDYVSQIAEYKAAQAPSALALRSALLDPAVNLLFEKLKKELKATKAKLEETQNELSAWKFTPDSNTGKRLMAKCRLLYQENEELGKMTSNGRLAKLETELAMQKSFREEVKKSQSELDDFLQELDEDVEGMQSTILFLQQELKTTRDRIQVLEKENFQLKNGATQDVVKAEVEDLQMPLNGNVNAEGNTKPLLYNSSLQQPTATTNVAIEMKYSASSTLETIDENNCLRTSQHAQVEGVVNVVATNDICNGNTTQSEEHATPTAVLAGDDGSNSSSNNSANGKMRTAASRKRNYDSDSIENNNAGTLTAVAVVPQVAMPRTLPPKKSKLRIPPVRRASTLTVEQNEHQGAAAAAAIATGGGGVVVPEILGVGMVVDNAVVGMAMEEVPPNTAVGGILVDEAAIESGTGGVAQRIMTRRRSVRSQQQQNGNGGGGGESNH